MAHTGKIYPIKQKLRYIHNTVVWPYYLADEYDFVGSEPDGYVPHPSPFIECRCGLDGWSPGDRKVFYHGSPSGWPNIIVEMSLELSTDGAFCQLDHQLYYGLSPQFNQPTSYIEYNPLYLQTYYHTVNAAHD